jgi:hypothetical protein
MLGNCASTCGGTHLYRPHPKLGIATRTELAGFDLES